jgi:two-component system, cell cycle sensor histidine kinase and response regulator CckA
MHSDQPGALVARLRARRIAASLFASAIACWLASAPLVFSAESAANASTNSPATAGEPLVNPARGMHPAVLPAVFAAGAVCALVPALLLMRSRRARKTTTTPVKDAQLSNRARYGALLENANDLIQGIALDGKLLYANHAWHDLLDFTDAEMKRLTIFDIVSPDCLESFKTHFLRAAAGAKLRSLVETTFITKFGKRVLVEGSLHSEVVDDRPVAIQGIFRDVTERKRHEDALKQSEERFSRVFAASPIAIAICTIDGGRVLDANDSFRTMLGYDQTGLIGRTDVKLGFWVDTAERERIFQRVKGGAAVRDEHCRLRSTSGNERQALVSAEAIYVNNEQCVLLMMHDNTERLNLEAQLRQAQKMEGIGQLAAGIAHDFNNILTVIQGHVARLRDAGTVALPIRDSVGQVLEAADRAATLTRQLLTFCRKQAFVPRVIDLNGTVKHVSAMLDRLLGENISLELKLTEGIPCVNADSAMLELALINLACNARDAMPQGGHLTVSSAAVMVPPSRAQKQPNAQPGEHICLTVADTGCGMPPEVMQRIFEPFFTTKDVGKGTGLGLATVYGIVEQHHGWIEVTSEVGVGTTFKLFLPKSKEARPQMPIETPVTTTSATSASSAATTHVQRGERETILLVEDEPALRELAKVVLEDCNYRILEAGSGVQALKVWEQHRNEIDMLLTDMVMPEGMSGRDLAEKLQAERPGLKVLYSSGYSPDVIGGQFKLPPNSFFLPKPYLPPKLASAVRECLDHDAPVAAAA